MVPYKSTYPRNKFPSSLFSDDSVMADFKGAVASWGASVLGRVVMGASEGGVIPAMRREFHKGSIFVRRLYIVRER